MALRLRNTALLFVVFSFFSCMQEKPAPISADWPTYRGDDGVNAWSGLNEINRENVGDLQVAWEFHTGDTIGNSSIECNPLIIGNTLYGVSPALKVFALDAATGNSKWIFDPFDSSSRASGVSRGLAYWKEGNEERIFTCVLHKLLALDARSGKQIMNFGDSGYVDMRKGLRNDDDIESYFIRNTSPAVIFKDLVIVGSSMGETYRGLPGTIRAYDVRTGRLRWKFNTIPQPGEEGYKTWPEDAYQYASGANAWCGMSIDRRRGMLFAATGAPSFDFHGGDRKGDNLFANSIVAIDANTGKRIWHFQVSHHDLWDYDLPSPPNLVTLEINGRKTDAVVQITKQGLIFTLDRETGKPLFPVEERPVPSSWMEDEFASAIQPFPLLPPPLVRQEFNEQEITNISDSAHKYVSQLVASYDFGAIYTPPNTKGIVQLPGFRGGGEWSGASIDREKNIMYIGVNDIANIVELAEIEDDRAPQNGIPMIDAGKSIFVRNCATCHGADRKGSGPYPSLIDVKKRLTAEDVKKTISNGRSNMPAFAQFTSQQKEALVTFLFQLKSDQLFRSDTSGQNPPSSAKKYKINGYRQLRDHEGYPGTKPPWGMLKAVDLNKGKLIWSRPLGEFPELAKRGIRHTGTQLFGGGITTAGGLIFIGASQDEKFRAIDSETGNTLWEYDLPAGGYATPATYEVDGTQYVVIAAGGGGFQNTKPGDGYIAFKLKK